MQPVKQASIHAFGQHSRQPGVDAQAADMRDIAQGIGQFRQLVVGQREWIAAGQDHFVDRCIAADQFHGLAPARCGGGVLGVRIVTAEAVAAMHRAASGGDQQGAAVVFVDHPAAATGVAITHCIQVERRRCVA